MPPKRILFVATEAWFFVTHRLPLAIATREQGYEVIVATPRGRGLDAILAKGFAWHELPVRRSTRNPFRELWAVPGLVRLYRSVQPDLVHHVAIKAVLYGTLAARLTGVPAVVNAVTGLGTAFGEESSRLLLGRALSASFKLLLRHRNMKVVFQNDDDRNHFVSRGWIGSEEAVVIRGSGVDPDEFRPADTPPSGPPLVLFASRLLISKGVREFVEMARRLRAEGSGARFAIAGQPDPDSFETIKQEEIDRWSSDNLVEVWGSRSDMAEQLRKTAIFCLPTYYREGVPKALIEAAASGVVSVTTDTPGCRDVVIDGKTGLLVPPRDVNALAFAVRELLADPERRAEMGKRARTHVMNGYTIEHVVRAMMTTYERLLNDRT